jgi:hypothetical protein
MKPYTIFVHMNYGDIGIWHGWAENVTQARELIAETYKQQGWAKDVVDYVIHNNRIRKSPGFTLLTQIAGG